MRKRRLKVINNICTGSNAYSELIKLWCLRILVKLGGHHDFVKIHCFSDDNLKVFLGLEAYDTDEGVQRKACLIEIRKQYKEITSTHPKHPSGPLTDNLAWLSQSLRLTKTEQNLLVFIALMHEYSVLRAATETLGELGYDYLCKALATILGTKSSLLHKALAFNGTLSRSGLITLKLKNSRDINDIIDIIEGLPYALMQNYDQPYELLDQYFSPSPDPVLSQEDFEHLNYDFSLLLNYLGSNKKRHRSGINILIHGQPGTGKTQLSRAIAHSLGHELFEIGMKKPDGNPLNGIERFSIYQLAQSLLERRKNCLILFDEVEDVFPPRWHWIFGNDRTHEGRKAWINQLLEYNPVPSIWLTNSTEQIDQATLRRFDLVIECRLPPLKIRKKLLASYLKGLPVSSEWVDNFAENDQLAPAYIERAAKVVRQLNLKETNEIESAFAHIINNTLSVMDEKRAPRSKNQDKPTYSLDNLNTDQNLSSLTKGLTHSTDARICLYGPPGTGKTAFGEYLSRYLNMPLIKKQASSLISPFCGETEKNIAKMFQSAEEEKAILLLDEADSFLHAIRGKLLKSTSSSYRWKISTVSLSHQPT